MKVFGGTMSFKMIPVVSQNVMNISLPAYLETHTFMAISIVIRI